MCALCSVCRGKIQHLVYNEIKGKGKTVIGKKVPEPAALNEM